MVTVTTTVGYYAVNFQPESAPVSSRSNSSTSSSTSSSTTTTSSSSTTSSSATVTGVNYVITNVTVGIDPNQAIFDSVNQNLYVVNSNVFGGATVSVISVHGSIAIGNISIGKDGFSSSDDIAYNSVNGDVYVGTNENSVVVISGTEMVANVSLGHTPYALLFDPSDGDVYTANYDQNSGSCSGYTVSVISGTKLVANVTVGSGPDSLAFDPSNNFVYVTNACSTFVSLVSGSSVVGNVTVPYGSFTSAYDGSNQDVYITNAEAGSPGNVTIISGEKVVASLAAGIFPDALAYDTANGYIYVIAAGQPGPQGISTVLAIAGNKIVGNVTVGNDALAILYNPVDQEIYVALFGPNQVAIISGSTLVGDINVGEGPSALALDQAGPYLYCVNYGFVTAGSVSVIFAG